MIAVTGSTGALGGLVAHALAADLGGDRAAGRARPRPRPHVDAEVRVCDVRRRGRPPSRALDGRRRRCSWSRRPRRADRRDAAPHASSAAAADAGVAHIVYTSFAGAGRRRDVHARPRPPRRRAGDPRERDGVHVPARQLLPRRAAATSPTRRRDPRAGRRGAGRRGRPRRRRRRRRRRCCATRPRTPARRTRSPGPEALTLAEVGRPRRRRAGPRAALRGRDGRGGLRVARRGVRRRASGSSTPGSAPTPRSRTAPAPRSPTTSAGGRPPRAPSRPGRREADCRSRESNPVTPGAPKLPGQRR